MEPIQGADSEEIAFAKRPCDVSKKGSEVCSLCAVDNALVIFSPCGKPFIYGHHATLDGLNEHYPDMLDESEPEKKHREKLFRRMVDQMKGWWNTPLDDYSLHELFMLKAAVEELMVKLNKRREELGLLDFEASSSSAANSSGTSDASVTNPDEGNPSVDPHSSWQWCGPWL